MTRLRRVDTRPPGPMRGAASRRGFTVPEVILAMVVMTVGVLALAGSAALLTRLIGRGVRSTHATFVAQQAIEGLRATAAGSGGCAALSSGSDTTGIYIRSWTITPGSTADGVRVILSYTIQKGQVRSDTISTTIGC